MLLAQYPKQVQVNVIPHVLQVNLPLGITASIVVLDNTLQQILPHVYHVLPDPLHPQMMLTVHHVLLVSTDTEIIASLVQSELIVRLQSARLG